MTEKNIKNEKILKNGFNLWIVNFKKNWKAFILKLFLYLIPLIVVEPRANAFIVGRFYLILIFVVCLFWVNEFIEAKKLLENDKLQKELKTENEELEKRCARIEQYSESIGLYLENIPDDFLENVFVFLKLKNSERISLYVLSENKFLIIGRYSANPTYNRRGRDSYPSECGYIAKCLSNDNGKDYYYKSSLPANNKKYVEEVIKDTGMSEQDIEKLSMKSRTYFTKVIKDTKNKNVGILVIESRNSKLPISCEELNNKMNELCVPHMATLLDVSNKLKGDVFNEK